MPPVRRQGLVPLIVSSFVVRHRPEVFIHILLMLFGFIIVIIAIIVVAFTESPRELIFQVFHVIVQFFLLPMNLELCIPVIVLEWIGFSFMHFLMKKLAAVAMR